MSPTTVTPYFPPPEDYRSPSERGCQACGRIIAYVPVVGGFRWTHVAPPEPYHAADPGRWWDTATGQWEA